MSTHNAQVVSMLQKRIESATILIFSKSFCSFCNKVKQHLKSLKIPFGHVELDKLKNGKEIQAALQHITKQKTVPQIFIRGQFIGDSAKLLSYEPESLTKMINDMKYEYDLVVIGGGSGGLSLVKRAAGYGAKATLLDFVNPTPHGTTWGLGGTCVNVGCIPKKLMHQSALLHHAFLDSKSFGWNLPDSFSHDWSVMIEGIQDHIHSLNFGYRSALMKQKIPYKNAFGKLLDNHTIETKDKNGVVSKITANTIVIATGERPRYPNIEGAHKYGITSDDLFSLNYCPGKTLLIGASYVALECAGFLRSLNLDVTVMVRSILLRGFDQQMANMVGDYMEAHGTRFIRECIPSSITEIKPHDKNNQKPGLYEVTGKYNNGTQFKDTFNTIIYAIGRDPCTSNIGLEEAGVKLDKNNRVIVDDEEMTNIPNIFAIGDISSKNFQLTPVAIQAGKDLADRLYSGHNQLTEYSEIATTVFTPLEYGAIGLSEESAIEKYGSKNIEVYHSNFQPLEWTVPHREDNICFAKLICLKPEFERIVGFHVLGPNAGEITQGYAVGMKLGATKADFDRTIGIHPTCSEVFTTLHVTKASGLSPNVTGC